MEARSDEWLAVGQIRRMRILIWRLLCLQLAASQARGPSFLLRGLPAQFESSPAPLRLLLQPQPAQRLAVTLLKRRGPVLAKPILIDLPQPEGAVRLREPNVAPTAIRTSARASVHTLHTHHTHTHHTHHTHTHTHIHTSHTHHTHTHTHTHHTHTQTHTHTQKSTDCRRGSSLPRPHSACAALCLAVFGS